MSDKIRWGIISTGNIADRFAGALGSLSGAELAAVASRDLDSANIFAKKT